MRRAGRGTKTQSPTDGSLASDKGWMHHPFWTFATAVLTFGLLVFAFLSYKFPEVLPVRIVTSTSEHTTPTPTTPVSAPGTATPNQQVGIDLPTTYLGTWLGTIIQSPAGGNPTSLKVVFTGGKLGDRIGTATAGPFAACINPSAADITLQAVRNDSISITFAHATTNCLENSGGPTTVRTGANQLDWDLFLTYGEWRGQLSRTG